MRRYLISQNLEVGSPLRLAGDVFHHIHHVCRRGLGDQFELLNSNQEHAFLVQVTAVTKSELEVQILSSRPLPQLAKPYIHLVLSFPKPKVFEAVVEKAVELGVHSIHPILSDYSFFKSSEKLEAKSERWQKIIRSASQQSGRAEPLLLHPSQSLSDFLNSYPGADKNKPKVKTQHLSLAFYEGKAKLFSQFFSEQPMSPGLEHIWAFVGSEGGFSESEVQQFKEQGIASLSLGDQVLRVETACVSIISVLRYKSGAF